MRITLIILVVVGAGVSATTPRRLPPKCPFPSGPYVPPDCGPNAYFEVCSFSCPPQNCSTFWSAYECDEEACCKPECRCKNGFLRDDRSGLCIPQDECFCPCGPLEHFVRGSTDCQKTCANHKVTGPRSMCKPFTGCVCNKGRVRLNDDATGVCVLPKQCPTRKCPLFEHWEDCPSVCYKESCISKSPGYKCLLPAIPLPCKPRCICDKGYSRDTFGNCIPDNHCPVKKCPINEVWGCAQVCARDSCASIKKGFKCPPSVVSVCNPACTCKNGYLRDEKGICIPKEQCPASLRCGINEVAVECATTYPPQTCESIYTLYKPVANPPCKPGCDCRPGYLRNKHNICVPKEFCPTVPQNKCGPFQEYKDCGTACEPSCADLDSPNRVCTDQCVAGCFCKEGYVKDDEGNCIPRDQCPLPVCNKPNEEAKECGSYCEIKTCEDYNNTGVVCPAVCVRGCFCRKGYVRNPYGVCVLPKQCPPKPICLQDNEEYQPCGSSCPDNCNNYLDTQRICTQNCVPACNCKSGFVRNLEDNTCVKPEQCPKNSCTGQNESLNLCSSYCPVTCANRFTNGDWACATVCRVACDCIPGTLRNDSGVCVPVEQCTPPVCRQNENYQNCGTACPLTCENYKNPPKYCTLQCVEDCFCQDGFVRDRNMRCVKPEDCEPICPAGERFNECSAHCQDTCENYDQPNRICTYQCESGCVCEPGTVRRNDGKCVTPLECSPQPTCANDTEVYSPCSAHCEPTCENSSPNQPCSRICKPGCKCIDGLVRRSDGQCVKIKECSPQPTCTKDTEVYSPCSAHCEPTCENSSPNQPCTRICKPGCKCADGLVRRSDGKCVKVEECSPQPTCTKDTEVYSPCSAHCEPTCENSSPNQPCTRICKPGCKCADGLVRRSDGQCVKVEDCNQQTCSGDEVYDACSAHCEPTCENNGPNRVCTAICKPGCKCGEGLVRRKDGKCVKLKDCSTQNQTCSDPNAQRVECAPAPQCRSTCANPNPGPCILSCALNECVCKNGFVLSAPGGTCVPVDKCPKDAPCNGDANAVIKANPLACPSTCSAPDAQPYCKRAAPEVGCECKPGYLKSNDSFNSKCVKADDCPGGNPCGVNGTFVFCNVNCPTNNCPVDDSRAIIACSVPYPCPSGCACKFNHRRRSSTDRRCILASDCPPVKCTRPNEIWSPCPSDCLRENCADINNQPTTCNTLILNCQPKCICKKGYFRNDNDICVPAKQCPKPIQCKANEIYNPCRIICPPQTCASIYTRYKCLADIQCEPGCDCISGYLRNGTVTDLCIPSEKCPTPVSQPCSDPNAERVECAPAPQCRSTCEKPNPGPCILSCALNECVCKKGFVLSAPGGTCVPIDQCPKDASCNGDANAVIKANPLACPSTCNSPDAQPYCTKPGPAVGCECKPGYLKSGDEVDSKCIKPDDCKGGNPCGANGTFVWCNVDCPNNNCPVNDNRGIIACDPPFPCPSGCSCKLNHRRKSYEDRQCILASDCPAVNCTRPNEVWSPCPSACLRENCADINDQPTTCNTLVLNCQPQCICKKGHFRNDNDICVPAQQCPNNQQCSDPNAERVDCAPAPECRPTCASSNTGPCILSCAKDNCVCKKGYILSERGGKCIPVNQCPSVPCGKNETYVTCKVNCPTNNCPTTSNPNIIICDPTYPCPGGCICKVNYKRSNTNQQCILASECPPQKCKANEEWSRCPSECLAEDCANVNDPPVTCNSLVLNCQPRCVCKKGYFRDANRNCIPANKCPKPIIQCKVNEVYNPCRIICPPQTCASIYTSYNCLADIRCEPGCDCISGYLRNGTVTDPCIPSEKCPTPKPQCGDNESYQSCGSACPPTCQNRGNNCTACTAQCVEGCFCNKGFVRADDGTCVKPNKCPPRTCSDPNEIFDACPPTCPPSDGCSNLWSKFNCTGAVQCCKPQCRCKPGYLRKGSKCVPTKQCTTNTPECGLNEHYETNRNKCDLTCKNKDQQALIGPCQETSGCFCDVGYYRNTNGICVTKDQCPKPITCPKNEIVTECYNTCHTTCKTRIRGDGRVCPLACINTGCLCIPGYLRHDNGTCVPVSECSPPQCNENESYTACGTACPQTCQNRGDNCTSCTKQCVEGCFCNKGYIQADDESCVKPKDCPPRTCCDPNEIFDLCPPTCPPTEKCSNIWSKFDCSKASKCCKPQCRCKSGYYRSDKGKCITTQQCIHGEDVTAEPDTSAPAEQ